MMEFSLPQRPHTVASMSNHYIHSDSIAKILQEIENEASMLPPSPKILEKNHLKENFKRLKDIQAKAKQRSAEKQPLKPLRAVNKYSQVQPKVSEVFNANYIKEKRERKLIQREIEREIASCNLPKSNACCRSPAALSPCLSAKSECHRSLQQYKSLPQLNQVTQEDKKSDYSQCGRKGDLKSPQLCKPHLDFACPKSKQKCDTKSEVKHRLGQIPSYLTERKKQWELERERQLKLMEEANIPPGHTLLPDEERIETLELLKKNQEELLLNLSSLPVRNDTLRLQQYKSDLERQLAKVEEGIKIFSRPKVLIKNDT